MMLVIGLWFLSEYSLKSLFLCFWFSFPAFFPHIFNPEAVGLEKGGLGFISAPLTASLSCLSLLT